MKLEELQGRAEQELGEEEEEDCDGFWGGPYEGGEALCRVETRDERYPRGHSGAGEEDDDEEEDADIDRAEYLGGFSLCRVQTRTSDVYDHPYYGYDDDSDEEDVDGDENEDDEEADMGVEIEADLEVEEDSPELDDSHASDDSDEHDYDFDGDLDSQYEEDMRGWVAGEGDEEVSIHTGDDGEVDVEVEVEGVAVAMAVTQPSIAKGKARASEAEVEQMSTALEALLYHGGGELSRVKTRDEREGRAKVMRRQVEAEMEGERFEDAEEEGVVAA